MKGVSAARALPRRAAIGLIALYKRGISPLLPRACRFYPTCSDYASEAIKRFGLLRGGWLGLRRVLRCQPLCKGGFDPVPPRTEDRPEDPSKARPDNVSSDPRGAPADTDAPADEKKPVSRPRIP